MSLEPELREVDRRRATQALTAYICDDADTLTDVFRDTNNDDHGPQGLILALLEYCDWITHNTGDLATPPRGTATDPRDDE